jgi:GLPGLI family protein
MYLLFFTIICLFVSQEIYAQRYVRAGHPRNTLNTVTVDSGNIRVLYALNALNLSYLSTYDDLQRLEIGAQYSKYYSYFTYISDSLHTDCEQKTPPYRVGDAVAVPCGREGSRQGKDRMWSEYYYSEYYKDFSVGIFNEYVRMPFGMPEYYYSENMAEQNWNLYEDTLTVAGYLCQKAACRFRGRDYTAWFTADIPVNNGPWKFGGLPGLILKVYDADKLYIFECAGIENHKIKYPIEMFDYKKYLKIKREKLLKLQRSVNEDYIGTIAKSGIIMKLYSGKDINSLGPEIKQEKIPYHPLELE